MFARLWQKKCDPLAELDSDAHLNTASCGKASRTEGDQVEPQPLPAVDGCCQGIFIRDGQLRMTIPELYHRLQNLTQYPHALPLARRFYLKQLSHYTASSSSHDILSLPARFDPAALRTWLQSVTESTTAKFESYVARRRAGGDREMFKDHEDAVRWCRESAVVKYVDGAWIQGVYRHNTAGASRKAARTTWQVLSEELGDGDLERSHVAAYERLMDDFGGAPRGYERDMIVWLERDGEQPNKQPWMAALLQLCAAMSPTEFLPEILGFNLSYESLPLHLLITSRELKELKIDPYYFILHISIDNGHSGHSAMARMAVEDYLLDAERTHGHAHADQLWRRVQAGYVLANSVRTTPNTWMESPTTPEGWDNGILVSSDELGDVSLPKAVLRLFRAKAAATIGLHAASRAMIGNRDIGHWLDPKVLENEGGEQFMTALANSKAWIKPGDPEESRFYRATQWGGKMFGAFTVREASLLQGWITSLPKEGRIEYRHQLGSSGSELEEQYWVTYNNFIGGPLEHCSLEPVDLTDLTSGVASWDDWTKAARLVYTRVATKPDAMRYWHSDFPSNLGTRLSFASGQDVLDHLNGAPPSIDPESTRVLLCLITAPLEWISCSYPAKLNSPMGMILVKILRVLYGFTECEGSGCSGTDEVHFARPGVRELVLGASIDPAGKDLALAALILALNSRPEKHLPILLGITTTLVITFLCRPSITCGMDVEAQKALTTMVQDSIVWLVKAIDLGFASPHCNVWEGHAEEWSWGLSLGVSLALKGLGSS